MSYMLKNSLRHNPVSYPQDAILCVFSQLFCELMYHAIATAFETSFVMSMRKKLHPTPDCPIHQRCSIAVYCSVFSLFDVRVYLPYTVFCILALIAQYITVFVLDLPTMKKLYPGLIA